MNTQHTTQQDFKGFDDFVELFRAGDHVDASGVARTWTTDELDQMVANHSAATAAPIVIGHPEHNDPAFGWIDQVKRDGDSLLAKFRDVNPAFAQASADGAYRKRSVRIYKTPANTFALEHVGFLGAKRPAIALNAMNYTTANAAEVFDFEADWYTPNVVARMLRRLRDWLIGERGLDVADQLLPDYEITSLDNHANELLTQSENAPQNNPMFTAPTGEITVTPAENQAAIDAAVAAALDAKTVEFSAQQTNLQQQLDAERRKNKGIEFSAFIQGSNLTPAQATGAVDFMVQLDDGATFEFSAGDGKAPTQVTPLKWFRDFVAAIPQQVKLGQTDTGAELDMSDPVALADAAQEFQASEKAAGRDIHISAAMQYVTQRGK